MHDWFDARKAAQVAAFFCERAGGSLNVLKLVKLIYIADRMSMERTAYPITNDKLVSMDHGPVNSLTLSHIDGHLQSAEWSELIAPRRGYEVSLQRELTEEDYDDLSEVDLEVLAAVWAKFGHMSKYQIRDWTHNNCPEWEDPNGSSSLIPHERVLKFLGVGEASEIAQEIEAARTVESSFRHIGA